MYDKLLYEKILECKCSYDELKNFNKDIDKKEFDQEDAFIKYYSLERVLYAISRYEKKEVDDRYLASWMNAYNWIIMAGFKSEQEGEITFQDWIVWEISDWLDSLSFFDDSDDWYNLLDYKNSFIIIDKIYNNASDWTAVFAHTKEWGDNDDDVVILAISQKNKEFVKMYGTLDYLNNKVDIEKITVKQLKAEMKILKNQGFTQLKYGLFKN